MIRAAMMWRGINAFAADRPVLAGYPLRGMACDRA